jgi:hypothetical protein
MGKLVGGILGGVSGVVGAYECYIVNGEAFVRKRRRKTTKPSTEKQLSQRQRMKIVNDFLSNMQLYVSISFAVEAKRLRQRPNNALRSYLMTEAVAGVYPDLRINYEEVKLSIGSYPGPEALAFEATGEELIFSWQCDPKEPNYIQLGQMMIAFYCPELGRWVYKIGGACRYDKAGRLSLPEEFAGKELHGYFSFISVDRGKASDSVYIHIPAGS